MVGDGTKVQKKLPTKIPGLDSGVVAISAGEEYTCALMSDEKAMCWGHFYLRGKQYSQDPDYWRITPRQVTGWP